MIIREKFIVTGDINDGGIRYFSQMKATPLKITGFSKKSGDRTIYIEAQGEKENIEKFKEILYLGNGFFKVENIERREIELIEKERYFLVK